MLATYIYTKICCQIVNIIYTYEIRLKLESAGPELGADLCVQRLLESQLQTMHENEGL
jgi:hypothetical protein